MDRDHDAREPSVHGRAPAPDDIAVNSDNGLSRAGAGQRSGRLTGAGLTAGSTVSGTVGAVDSADDRAQQAAGFSALGARQGLDGLLGEAVDTMSYAVGLWREVDRDAPEQAGGLADALRLYGALLGGVGRYEAAAVAAHESVTLARTRAAETPRPSAVVSLALALSVLGTHLMRLGRGAEGMAAAREATDIARSLFRDGTGDEGGGDGDREARDVALATALGNLGLHLRQDSSPREALSAEREASEVWRRLARADDAYESDLAGSLSNLGIHLAETGTPAEGLAAEEEAVVIRRGLTARSAPAHESDLARSLSNLAVRLVENDRWAEADGASRETVGIYRRLADALPAVHTTDLARSLSQRAGIVAHERGPHHAVDPADEAVRLYTRLAGANPEAHDEELARVLAAKGRYLTSAGEAGQAAAALTAEVEVRRRLSRRLPHHTVELFAALERLAGLLDSMENREDSAAARAEAVDVLTEYADDFPEESAPHLALALMLRSEQLGDNGDYAAAFATGERGIAVMRGLVGRGEDLWGVDLGNALANSALWLAALDRDADAVGAADEAIALYHAPPAAGPRLPPQWLARILGLKGRALSRLGRYEEALAVHIGLAGLLEELLAVDPAERTRSELADVLAVIGSMTCALGDTERGTEYLERALEVYALLTGVEAASCAGSRVAVLLELTSLAESSDDLSRAVAHTELAESVCRGTPAGPTTGEELLASVLRRRAALLARSGSPVAAVDCLREAAGILRDLAGDGHGVRTAVAWAEALGELSALLVVNDDLDGALDAAGQQTELLCAVQTTHPAEEVRDRLLNARSQLHRLLRRVAVALVRDGRSALPARQEAASVKAAFLAALREAAAADPPKYAPHLPAAMYELGVDLLVLRRFEECRGVVEEGVELGRRLWGDDPHQRHWLGLMLGLLSDCRRGSGEAGPARAAADEAVEVWTRLRDEGHPAATDARLAEAVSRIAPGSPR
ncbi:hypothetical protein [Streptomyces sp. NPDC091416]|uniref:hypothetical protein n=1 Tax=Streptomyces sp. NPDC091416 TaxID=3366003 RepID=UPI003808F20A